ncbi:hypothetical protein BDV96DRAFT_607720 [Lophiotrema nucula]|uniref:Uncharacterized protein n=1 Tax=Lophiotrema nucula TaxID=690887 RepID=A0A6A5YIA9_9PLEO|nr:hypothetical protein BDV96DRAFT_607720 [Lophiotrema nucula]
MSLRRTSSPQMIGTAILSSCLLCGSGSNFNSAPRELKSSDLTSPRHSKHTITTGPTGSKLVRSQTCCVRYLRICIFTNKRPEHLELNRDTHWSLIFIDVNYGNIVHYDSAGNMIAEVAEFWKCTTPYVFGEKDWNRCFEYRSPTWVKFPSKQGPPKDSQIRNGDCGSAVLWTLGKLLSRLTSPAPPSNQPFRQFPHRTNWLTWEVAVEAGSIEYGFDWEEDFDGETERDRIRESIFKLFPEYKCLVKDQATKDNVIEADTNEGEATEDEATEDEAAEDEAAEEEAAEEEATEDNAIQSSMTKDKAADGNVGDERQSHDETIASPDTASEDVGPGSDF